MCDVLKRGIVTQVRIFMENNETKAEITFAFGGQMIITWTDVYKRKKVFENINGYTLFIDERVSSKT